MAASKVRQSKFRHIFGTEFQAAEQFRDIRHSSFGVDGIPLKATATHFAVPYPVPGAICVVKQEVGKGALDHESPPLFLHPTKEEVLDCQFATTDPSTIATVHGNGDLLIWAVPADGPEGLNKEPIQTIQAHPTKRVTLVDWHPLASHTVLTVDSTKASKLTDVNAAKVVLELANPYKGLVTSVAWSALGDRLATYAKDKKLRVFDPRSAACTVEVEDHSGVKAGSVVWAHAHDLLFTVGHSRTQSRCYSLWDPRNMSKRVASADLDTSSSSLVPLLDQDTSVLLLGSRGDGSIRAFEIAADGVFPLSEFKSVDPTAGLALLPKTSCNVAKNEIVRILKLVPSKNIVIPIRFEIPRVVSHFQDDLYPDTWDGRPSMSSADWFAGANTPPHKISLAPSS